MDKRDQSYNQLMVIFQVFSNLPINIDENQTVVNGYEFTTYDEYIDNQVLTLSFFAKSKFIRW